MFMTNQQSPELAKPGVGAFDDPASFITSQLSAIFISPLLIIVSVGNNQIDPLTLPSFTQGVGIIGPIGNYPLGFLFRPAFTPGDTDLFERGLRKRNFCRRGTLQPNSQRNTLTVSQYHPLCAFPPFGLADCSPPFLAGAKLPSRKASSHFNKPRSSNSPSNVRQAFNHTPSSCHCCSRRQQVEGEGYWSGRNRHAAPVCRIHRMPSKQARFGAGGRPRPSFRTRGSGNSALTNSHCSFVNSFCRFFIAVAHQLSCLTHKYSL